MNRRVLTLATVTALLGSVLLGSGAAASLPAFPADIYEGSCADVGGPLEAGEVWHEPTVAAKLAAVSSSFAVDGTLTASQDGPVGAGVAVPVQSSVTTVVPLALGTFVDSPHSILVHGRSGGGAPPRKLDVLCGDIGGTMMGAADLVFGLGGLNDHGYTGIALNHDNGDSTVMVTIYITTGVPASPATDVGGRSSPEPSPSPAP